MRADSFLGFSWNVNITMILTYVTRDSGGGGWGGVDRK